MLLCALIALTAIAMLSRALYLPRRPSALGALSSARRGLGPASLFGTALDADVPSASSHLAVHVRGQVIPGSGNAFLKESIKNAAQSILEPGIARFDVLRRVDEGDTNDFLLVEVYRTKEGPAQHKETSHYAKWRDAVATVMSKPRAATKYATLFPSIESGAWDTAKSAASVNPDLFASQLPWDGTPARGPEKPGYSSRSLLAVVVHIHVKENDVDAFIKATLANCRASVCEGGVARFDFLRDVDDSTHFSLVEVYSSQEAAAAHKKTKHYSTWATEVAPMMAKPRTAERYASHFPAPLFLDSTSSLSHQSSRGHSASFGFLSPRIVFGRGVASGALKQALRDVGATRPFIVTGKSGLGRHMEGLFRPALGDGYEHYRATYAVTGEPTVEDALAATQLALDCGCDSVVAVGGGSAVDLGKAVSALATNREDVFEYLEVVGKGKSIPNSALPLIAVPTTAGTGSEATKNAVLKSKQHGRKASIRHDSMIPRVAIVDPLLTVTCPPDVTAHVGLDTLCQVIEPYVSNAANPFSDALAKEGIVRAARSLRAVVANGSDVEAREDLSIASVLGGLCLANSKLGAVHGFAAVLGGVFDVAPHGAICAALTPHVFRANAEKLATIASLGGKDGAAALSSLQRFDDVARLVTGNHNATWEDGVAWLDALVKDLCVPGLSSLCGLRDDQVKEIAEATTQASSTKGNPVVLSSAELEIILRKAM